MQQWSHWRGQRFLNFFFLLFLFLVPQVRLSMRNAPRERRSVIHIPFFFFFFFLRHSLLNTQRLFSGVSNDAMNVAQFSFQGDLFHPDFFFLFTIEAAKRGDASRLSFF
jgi:hypothetical protein